MSRRLSSIQALHVLIRVLFQMNIHSLRIGLALVKLSCQLCEVFVSKIILLSFSVFFEPSIHLH